MWRGDVRRPRRTSATYPGEGYFWAGLLVIFAFGMTLAAIQESYTAADWVWFTVFVHFEVALCGVYFWIVHCWLTWVDQTGDH